MPYAAANDLQMHYEESGAPDGAPLVLLHGFTSTGAFWREQIEPFGARHRLIVPDWRGHGRTGNPAGPAGMNHRQFARDAIALCGELGLVRPIFCGESSGVFFWRTTASSSASRSQSSEPSVAVASSGSESQGSWGKSASIACARAARPGSPPSSGSLARSARRWRKSVATFRPRASSPWSATGGSTWCDASGRPRCGDVPQRAAAGIRPRRLARLFTSLRRALAVRRTPARGSYRCRPDPVHRIPARPLGRLLVCDRARPCHCLEWACRLGRALHDPPAGGRPFNCPRHQLQDIGREARRASGAGARPGGAR